MTPQRREHEVQRDEGGPGSSHQGGTRWERDVQGQVPGEYTNPVRSRVSGGGGERDRHHVHDTQGKVLTPKPGAACGTR